MRHNWHEALCRRGALGGALRLRINYIQVRTLCNMQSQTRSTNLYKL